jgi:hypothetical protein
MSLFGLFWINISSQNDYSHRLSFIDDSVDLIGLIEIFI